MKDFNLIVTSRRFAEEHAEDEILEILENFGDYNAVSEVTNVTGLIVCHTTLDPIRIVHMLVENVKQEPFIIRYVLRVIPIEKIVESSLQGISDAAVASSYSKMLDGDSFRITVEKRHTQLRSSDIISAVASRIRNHVNLDQPDWTILIEIIGGQTGVSILRKDDIFSSVIEKRQ